jgi:hypothetical protein
MPDVTRILSALEQGALARLAEHDPLKAPLVELRYFAGLTGDQAARILGISPSTADRRIEWQNHAGGDGRVS